jgi:hypothetical protein
MGISQKTFLTGAGLAGAGVISALGFAALHWDRGTSQLINELRRAEAPTQRRVDLGALESLPKPVARYLRYALPDGAALIESLRVEQAGHFRSGGSDAKWQPFKASQHFSVDPPGFVWDAAIQIAPLTRVCVRDAYIAGAGSTHAKVLALMTVADARSRAELDTGALQRYLAETVWFPTALLPGGRVSWQAIDDHCAAATLADGANVARLVFHFNTDGEVVRIAAPRFREVNGGYELTPWEALLGDYAVRHGMRVPLASEAAWQVDGTRLLYFKARLTDLRFDTLV